MAGTPQQTNPITDEPILSTGIPSTLSDTGIDRPIESGTMETRTISMDDTTASTCPVPLPVPVATSINTISTQPAMTGSMPIAAAIAQTPMIAPTSSDAGLSTVASSVRPKPDATSNARSKSTTLGKRKANTSSSAASSCQTPIVSDSPPTPPPSSTYNRLDELDVAEARALGLLCDAIEVCTNPSSTEYGIAYEKRGGSKVTGCGTQVYPSQKALQERCKQFAMERGFQLYVAGSSSRADGGGNVKYKCKKLYGQQFYDTNTPANELECPFYINGYGLGPAWKTTKLCLTHNHYKFIGARAAGEPMTTNTNINTNSSLPSSNDGAMAALKARYEANQAQTSIDPILIHMDYTSVDPFHASSPTLLSEGTPSETIPVEPKPRAQRNTTLSTSVLCRMVNDELDRFPSSMSKVDGKLIKRILLSRGHVVNHMMASRIKRQIQLNRINTIRLSFQQLQSYFQIMLEKNRQSYATVEMNEQQVFKRALFIPHATLHVLMHCHKMIGLDRIHSTVHPWMDRSSNGTNGDNIGMNDSDDEIAGVYLYASTKDYNDSVIIFAVALVAVESPENWIWFLHSIQTAQANMVTMTPSPPPSSEGASVYLNWNDYTVFAGRSHGLQQALQTMWPGASHHLCVRRLIEEELIVMKKIPLSDDQKQGIYDMAHSESEVEFKHYRQELALTHETVVQYLDTINRANWVKYAFLDAFKKPTLGIVSADLMDGNDTAVLAAGTTGRNPPVSVNTSGMNSIQPIVVGSANGMDSNNISHPMHTLPNPQQSQPYHHPSMMHPTMAPPPPSTTTRLYKPCQQFLLKQWFGTDLPRSSQPLQVFARYFMKIAENFHAFRSNVCTRPLHELVPKRFTQLEQNLQASQRCESVPCSNGTYMVRSLVPLSPLHGPDAWRHVNLLDRECTCLEWQDRLFPCVHGIHASELNRRRIDSLYHANLYSIQAYKTCYEIGFTPWPLDAVPLQVNKVMKIAMDEFFQLDPNVKRKPGPRPKIRKLLVNV